MFWRVHIGFILDIIRLSFTAFGGPQAHLTLMLERMARKKKYITESELLELSAFCGILPGPTSTQTITGIAYKRGKLPLAALTLFIWALPATLAMLGLLVIFSFVDKGAIIRMNLMEYVQPMAIGFMLYSAFKMGKVVLTYINAWIILAFAILISALIPSVFTFPAIVLIAALIANFRKDNLVPYKFQLPLRWSNIFLFFGIFIATAVLGKVLRPLGSYVYRPFVLFENFYRFGSMVFGGGHLLYPLMYEQFVVHKHYLTASEILTGYGIQQALPGPVFSIAAYTGGLTMRDLGLHYEILGGAISAFAIFLPGTLLLFFLFPFWEHLRKYPFIKRSLMGINAAAIGMLLSTTLLSFRNMQGGVLDIIIIISTFILLSTEKIPGAFIVLTAILAAWIW